MKKNILVEELSFNPSFSLTESPNGGPMILRGIIQKAEVKNANNRIYPKDILRRAVESYITNKVNTNSALGELDHPDRSDISLGNVCHVIKKIWWDGNNVMAEMEIIDGTPAGNILKRLIEKRLNIGISSRALGSVKYNQRSGCDEVENDLEIICWDFVSTPSTPGALPKLVTESVNHNIGENTITKQNNINSTRINETIHNIFQDLNEWV